MDKCILNCPPCHIITAVGAKYMGNGQNTNIKIKISTYKYSRGESKIQSN